MDGRKSVIHNESMSPRSLITDMSSPVTTNTHVLPRHRKRKPNIAIPPPLNLESIEEERGLSDYDCGYLDLGAETPSTPIFMQNQAPLHIPRRRSFRRASPVPTNRLNKYADAVDRDCGICFEYAVLPCRTLCCGKIFCTEHLADWLHGPEAEGRCPNCENACSLAGGTLSLASPTERARRNKLAQAIHSSSSASVRAYSSDTLRSLRDDPQVASTSSSSTSSYSSSVDYSETTVSTEGSKTDDQYYIHHPFPNERISPRWGVASRLISILFFLMFLYKLRS